MFVKLACGVTLKQRVNFAQLLIYIESCLGFFCGVMLWIFSCCLVDYFFFSLTSSAKVVLYQSDC